MRNVARRIADARAKGHDVVAVVSAMGKATDNLVELARQVSSNPQGREMDMLLTTGERISMSLLCMALHDVGCDAVSFTGSQVGIITDTSHTKAKILEIKGDRVREALLAGKVAVVTGAARGIGAAIAEVLAREGATVVGMDRPAEEGALGASMAAINGVGLALDVTAPDAGERLASELKARFGGADIVVHNAGVTRDKMLRNMSPQLWDMVLDINLAAILNINERLLQSGLKPGARFVCISSIGGIGGNAGQTNYAATKAGVIGYAESLAPLLAKKGMAINAVAPGFIETQMTAAMPTVNREVGRRVNSLSQGGVPQDIAEAVTFFASPLANGINGRTLRVCGQNWLGA